MGPSLADVETLNAVHFYLHSINGPLRPTWHNIMSLIGISAFFSRSFGFCVSFCLAKKRRKKTFRRELYDRARAREAVQKMNPFDPVNIPPMESLYHDSAAALKTQASARPGPNLLLGGGTVAGRAYDDIETPDAVVDKARVVRVIMLDDATP